MAPKLSLGLKSTYKLNSGRSLPVLGYGVFKTPSQTARSVVAEALRCGYRHIDSAAYYGNEASCAEAILASGVPRGDVFFTSKVMPGSESYEGARKSIQETMKEVGGLGYIDLLLMHSPYGGTKGRLGAWRAMCEAVEEGLVRSIGVSNFGVHHLQELQDHIDATEAKEGKGKAGVISVNQIELHPWLQRKDIIEWCQSHGVLVQAWAPLAQANRWGDKLLQEIVKRTGKSEAQILIRWSLQKGFNPLPKSETPKRIKENADVFDFELSEADMEALETEDYDYHGWDPTTADL